MKDTNTKRKKKKDKKIVKIVDRSQPTRRPGARKRPRFPGTDRHHHAPHALGGLLLRPRRHRRVLCHLLQRGKMGGELVDWKEVSDVIRGGYCCQR